MPKVWDRIDVTDWAEEARQHEDDLTSLETAIEAMLEQGLRPGDIAKRIIGGRAAKLPNVDGGLLPMSKTLLYAGGRASLSSKIASILEDAKTKEGKSVRRRSLVAGEEPSAGDPDEDEDRSGPWVRASDPCVVDRAERYLLSTIPGHIRRHMVLIATNGGDVRAIADALKAEVDRVIDDLV